MSEKTVTMTSSEVYAAMEGLRELSAVALPVRASLQVRRFARELNELVKDVDEERMKIVAAHAVLGEDGKPQPDAQGQAVWKSPSDEKAWIAEYTELLKAEHPIVSRPFTADDFGTTLQVMPSTLMKLGSLLED